MRNLRGRKLGLGTGNLPAGHGAFGAGGQTTADQRRGGGAEMTMGAAHMLMTLPHPGPLPPHVGPERECRDLFISSRRVARSQRCASEA